MSKRCLFIKGRLELFRSSTQDVGLLLSLGIIVKGCINTSHMAAPSVDVLISSRGYDPLEQVIIIVKGLLLHDVSTWSTPKGHIHMVYSHGTLGATPGQLVTTLTSVMLNSVSEEHSPSRPSPTWGEDQGHPHRSTQPIHLGRRPVSGRPNPAQLRRRPVTGRPNSVHRGEDREKAQVNPTHYSGEKT
jgi:hypothetical protein